MRLLALLPLAALAACEFTCIKPVNPIPAGPPGVCCDELNQGNLLSFLYTGKSCMYLSSAHLHDHGYG